MRQTDLHIQELQTEFGDKEYFQVEDIFTFYQSFEPTIAKSTINWRIYTLVKTDVIKRIGRGKYNFENGKAFTPQITPKALKINSFMKTNFPYLKYIIWHISEINPVSQHLINKDTYYVEVERDAINAVFEQLREKFKYVLRGRTNEDVYFGESVIIVRSLVTGSPTQSINKFPTTTIEKLLVDLFADKEFEFLHGYELTHIFNNAFSKYTINIDKLLRYASRKAKREQISEFIKTIK
ncbi:MAG: hypothetical protein H6Q20_1775 [Bacteroidetes bacterium]|nr:hypothetical protein [Bacteroidota bacterium]